MIKLSHASALSADEFKAKFALVKPFILEEWTQLEEDLLEAAEGDLDLIVEHIASQTERTRTLIRRQLTELYQLALLETPARSQSDSNGHSEPDSNGYSEEEPDSNRLKESLLPSLEKSLQMLEKRAEKLLNQVEKEVLPKLDERVKENLPELNERLQERPGTSLLTALGIGFLIGLIFGGWGRGRR